MAKSCSKAVTNVSTKDGKMARAKRAQRFVQADTSIGVGLSVPTATFRLSALGTKLVVAGTECVDAVVDSGADISYLPATVAARIQGIQNSSAKRFQKIKGVFGPKKRLDVLDVELAIDGERPVVAELVVGQDEGNDQDVLLDGDTARKLGLYLVSVKASASPLPEAVEIDA